MNHSIENKILNTIIQTSNNNITITDEKGFILLTNPAHWLDYGIQPEDLIGKSVYQFQNEGVLSPSITAMVIQEHKPVQVMQKTKTGKIIMSTAYPIFDDAGNLIHIVSYSQDQTEISNLKDQYEQLKKKVKDYQAEVEELRGKEGILYRSKEMQQLVRTIHRVANTDATVLFLGESGVGKSMFARKLHDLSSRKQNPFIEVNCSTIPENLFESEMFGYESGAFTGAEKHGKQGMIEQAHNGTLFLDEIGELPLVLQVKLLKVLQEKKFMRIGGKKERHIDFRLITATNQNLEDMVQKGEFRLDLYYRLNVIPLYIPPLRDRREDIAILINHYLELINQRHHTKKSLHTMTYDILTQYDWPGNIRELENLIERLILTTEESVVLPHFLPSSIQGKIPVKKVETAFVFEQMLERMIDHTINGEDNLKSLLEKVEKTVFSLVNQNGKTTYEIAKILGISQPSVVRKLNKYKDIL